MYKNLDMPVKVFHKIIETGSLLHLYTGPAKHSHAKRIRRSVGIIGCAHVWERISDEFIKEFGVSKEFELLFYKQRDILKLEIDNLLGDQSADFLIRQYKHDYERLKMGISQVSNYRKHHAQLHRMIQVKWPGRQTNNLSVFEFYNDLNDIINEDRQMEVVRDGTNG